jgi:pyrroline-5-carboxylate reductase
MKLLFVGGGNMAGALIGGLLKRGWAATDLQVVEIAAEARRVLREGHGIDALDTLPAALSGDHVLLLAVKPQHLQSVAGQLRPLLAGQLVVTIAAGIRTRDLSRWLGGHARVIRAMPNTPAGGSGHHRTVRARASGRHGPAAGRRDSVRGRLHPVG